MSLASILKTCHSWEQFASALKDLPNKSKGDYFERLVQYYLQLEPKYATKLSEVWLLNEVPSKVNKRLNLPSLDEGIDLVAKIREGTFWAIQCKYRQDESKSLTRRELSTFTDLTFAVCHGFDHALVCTNTDRRSRKLELYGDRLSFCAGDEWRELDADFFRRLRQLLAGRAPRLKPYKPRPHQKRAIANAQNHFLTDGSRRGKMILPCGTGKSLTGYWIAEALDAKTVLVAVPSLALIKQTLEVWAKESLANGHEVDWICVCSDESVARTERDDAAVLTQDLGVQVHTDPDQIASWLRKRGKNRRVVFTTYQSGKATAEAARSARRVFDLGILDEAHKTVGKRDSLFGHLLHEENIRIRKRVSMTATERHYRGSSDQIASMDDPDLYGDTFELVSFSKALEAKPPILSDYRIVTIAITHQEIASLIKENLFIQPDKGSWDEDVEAEMLASAVALRKAMQKHPIHHAVSFHSSIARARAFRQTQDVLTETFSVFGELSTFHVSGRTPTSVRSRELDDFAEAERALVTNARCLTEGVDVPDIDCVLFADPKKSTVDIVQAVGRALRVVKGKKFGYVVVPILLDTEVSEDAPIPINAYDSVLMVLRSLAANDERIIEYFRSVAQGKRPSGRSNLIETDVPVGFEIDADAFIQSVELKLWSRLAKLSWRPFHEARDFARRLGLSGSQQWFKYCAGSLPVVGQRPIDIPSSPSTVYREQGWVNWGDWLGTGEIAPFLKEFRRFPEARRFARGLGLKSYGQWIQFCKGKLVDKGSRPADIPSSPNLAYRDSGWNSWGDWLGTDVIAPRLRIYKPFKQARQFARKLGLRGNSEWRRFCKGELPKKGTLPKDIPASPERTYRDRGWDSWGDWLGTGYKAHQIREYRSFPAARRFVRGLALASGAEWRLYCQGKLKGRETKPVDIPTNPQRHYRDQGWQGMGDWLGTGSVAPRLRRFRPFEEARDFARNLGLASWNEWRRYSKGEFPNRPTRPIDIPAAPNQSYKGKGWVSWGDWLGTESVATIEQTFRGFELAREFARGLGLRSAEEWRRYVKGELGDQESKPPDIPAAPQHTYKQEGWISWPDWLGTIDKSRFRDFDDARDFARYLGLQSSKEWKQWAAGAWPGTADRPVDIPSHPETVYRDSGWIDWGDWLGTRSVATIRRVFLSFQEARRFARSLRLSGAKEWHLYSKGAMPEKGEKPFEIPAAPNVVYRHQGWISWPDWLGTSR